MRTNQDLKIYKNDSFGAFTQAYTLNLPLQFIYIEPTSLTAGHLDNGNNVDLVLTNDYYFLESSLVILKNISSGGNFNFNVGQFFPYEEDIKSAVIGDFSGDEINDIALLSKSRISIRVLINNGAGNFSSSFFVDPGTTEFGKSLIKSDLGGHSVDDLVLATNNEEQAATILYDGSRPAHTYPAPGGAFSAAAIDIDKNSTKDLILSIDNGIERGLLFLRNSTEAFIIEISRKM